MVRDYLESPMNRQQLMRCIADLSPGARVVIKGCLSKLPVEEVIAFVVFVIHFSSPTSVFIDKTFRIQESANPVVEFWNKIIVYSS
jgi:hypothetical protein